MQTHKFRVGQRVNFVRPAYLRLENSEYEIVGLLPAEAGQMLYRIKSAAEHHDRVVGEEQLAVRGRLD